MEKEKPEVYKEAMEHILKELGKLKMEEYPPGFPETGMFPGKRGETGNRHRAPLYGDCLYGGFCTQDAWSYSYFISNYKSSFLLKNYFSCDR